MLDDAASLVRRWLQEVIAGHMQKAPNLLPQNDNSAITNEIAATHFASSILNLIAWWLDRQFPYSIEQMGQIYEDLMLEPTLQAVRRASQE